MTRRPCGTGRWGGTHPRPAYAVAWKSFWGRCKATAGYRTTSSGGLTPAHEVGAPRPVEATPEGSALGPGVVAEEGEEGREVVKNRLGSLPLPVCDRLQIGSQALSFLEEKSGVGCLVLPSPRDFKSEVAPTHHAAGFGCGTRSCSARPYGRLFPWYLADPPSGARGRTPSP